MISDLERPDLERQLEAQDLAAGVSCLDGRRSVTATRRCDCRD